MLAVTAVLICAKDFSVGKITAIKVKGIANSKFKCGGIFASIFSRSTTQTRKSAKLTL